MNSNGDFREFCDISGHKLWAVNVDEFSDIPIQNLVDDLGEFCDIPGHEKMDVVGEFTDIPGHGQMDVVGEFTDIPDHEQEWWNNMTTLVSSWVNNLFRMHMNSRMKLLRLS